MNHKPDGLTDPQQTIKNLESRIVELETQIAYFENTVEQLDLSIGQINQEFLLAKEAMQLINKRIESIAAPDSDKGNIPEPPPPHY